MVGLFIYLLSLSICRRSTFCARTRNIHLQFAQYLSFAYVFVGFFWHICLFFESISRATAVAPWRQIENMCAHVHTQSIFFESISHTTAVVSVVQLQLVDCVCTCAHKLSICLQDMGWLRLVGSLKIIVRANGVRKKRKTICRFMLQVSVVSLY